MKRFQPAPEPLAAAVQNTTDRLAQGRQRTLGQLVQPEAARARARQARQQAVSRLPETLATFEAAARARGTVVHRAPDAAAARRIIADILRRAGARRVVKSKSMATEEVGLREHLERHGLHVVETDLGEWIVQLAGQAPSHIIVPAVHLRRAEISRLLSRVAGRPLGEETTELAGFARQHLRQEFLQADAGVSGANLLVAETGTLLIVSNEGNARMCTTLPRLHVALVGVEKVVNTWAEALDVLAVLPPSATGQRITQYVSLLTGPGTRAGGSRDGPAEMHVVLLDNGRSALVGTPAEELLYCIRCGACLNVCPVYRTMGGHAYESVYPGPIGAVLTPRLSRGRQGRDLPWASSLCGACREVCPVNIQLDDQLIALRAEYPKPLTERLAMAAYGEVASSPSGMATALRVARVVLGGRPSERLPGPLDAWTRGRGLRGLAPLARHWLPRARAAVAPVPVLPPPPVPAGSQQDGDLAAVFRRHWEEQGGHFLAVRAEELGQSLRELVGSRPVSVDAVLDGLLEGVPAAEATGAEWGVVAAAAAAAATASLVLPSGEGSQRQRSLLPPRLALVLDEHMLLADLPAAMDALGLPGAQPPAAVTLISGPSRSSDIENDLVIGVHGPGEAWVLLVGQTR